MKKRLAILIAAAMLITSMPFYAFADDGAVTDGAEQPEVAADDMSGTESGEPAVTEDENEGEETSGAEAVTEDDDTGSTVEETPVEDTAAVDTADTVEETVVEDSVTAEAANAGETTGTAEEAGTGSDPAPAAPVATAKRGWNEDHTVYYKSDGKPYANIVIKISGVYYYFNSRGVVDKTTGWKKTAAGNWYYIKNGTIVRKPTKVQMTKTVTKKVKYYYNKKTKKWQTTYIKGASTKYVDTKVTETTNYLYMFRLDGRLKDTKGLFWYDGKEYYGYGGGALKTGWVALVENDKYHAMYFYTSAGYMAKNTTIYYLKIPASGRLGKAYYLGIKRLNQIGWSLRKAYNWSAKMKYQGRSYRAKTSEKYAIKGFTKGYGNCYCMAATFYIMAKLLGYDVHQVEGRVDLPHSWTVIKQDGREWVYDPNFTNETGRNGWKIYYGKKGTWRYNHYHKMN